MSNEIEELKEAKQTLEQTLAYLVVDSLKIVQKCDNLSLENENLKSDIDQYKRMTVQLHNQITNLVETKNKLMEELKTLMTAVNYEKRVKFVEMAKASPDQFDSCLPSYTDTSDWDEDKLRTQYRFLETDYNLMLELCCKTGCELEKATLKEKLTREEVEKLVKQLETNIEEKDKEIKELKEGNSRIIEGVKKGWLIYTIPCDKNNKEEENEEEVDNLKEDLDNLLCKDN